MRRLRCLPALLALVATVACGTTGGGSIDAGPAPSRTDAPTTTTAAAAGPTSPDATTAPGGAGTGGGTTAVQLFLTRGERLQAVPRRVPAVARVGAETVKALLAGPTAEEARSGLGTAIPRDTRFNDLVITDGVAKVDLSGTFESGGGTLSLTMRLAQVTCTLDQFDSVKGVRFALDGKLVNVFSGNGIVLDEPVTCAGYGDLLKPGPPAAAGTFAGIWPFATQAEIDAYAEGPDNTFRNVVDTAREFARRYVGIAEPVVIGGAVPSGRTVEVKVGFGTGEGGSPIPRPVATMTVQLQSLGSRSLDGDRNPWTVVGATADDIVVDAPKALDRVSSPVRLGGRARAFEGNVTVEVREDGMLSGQSLGKGFVTGGGDALRPFTGTLAFRPPSKRAGAVVFYELSAADGQSVLRATVVRVQFT